MAIEPVNDVAEANLAKDLIEKLDAAVRSDGQYRTRVAVPREVPSGVVADALDWLRRAYPNLKFSVESVRRTRNRHELFIEM